MGNDGGSIPRRSELVRSATRPPTASEAKATALEAQAHAWSTCPLSQQPLKPPIVSDCAGGLYNKDAVLEYLLPAEGVDGGDEEGARERTREREEKEKVLQGRVGGLRDVVEVKFHTGGGGGEGKWVCPVTDKELGPGTGVRSVYVVPCGHVFAEVAVREVKGGEGCLQCGEPYEPDNVITILPLAEAEKERLVKRAERFKGQGLTHSLKKAPGSSKKKKRKNAEALQEAAEGPVESAKVTPKPSSGVSAPSNGIKNASTASLTARVLAEEQAKAKRRKVEGNENLQRLFSKGPKGPMRDSDFMTRGHSVAADTGR